MVLVGRRCTSVGCFLAFLLSTICWGRSGSVLSFGVNSGDVWKFSVAACCSQFDACLINAVG